MFKKTESQQSLFGVATKLSDSARERLKRSWAERFRKQVLPVLMASEQDFARLYGSTGRPNYSVGRILGICLLQEMNDLSDQAALDALAFDVRWHHALDVDDEQAYLSRRSLVEFRRRLVEYDPEMSLMRSVFDRVSKGAIAKLGLSTSEQRLDSTLVMSNIREGGVLELFRSAVRKFMKGIDAQQMAKVAVKTRAWFEENREGWFGLGPSERRDKLSELLPTVKELLDLFSEDAAVRQGEGYRLLRQCFDEHCEVVTRKVRRPPPKNKGKHGGKRKTTKPSWKKVEEIVLKKKKGARLQSVHDPDAEYGHKGVGYKVHVTETCNNEASAEIITDYEVHGNARSDIGKARGVVKRLEHAQIRPDKLYADAGYPTPEDLVELKKRGTDLVAPVHRGAMKEAVMSRADFRFDGEGRVARCPRGCKPIDHRIQNPNGQGVHLHAYFDGDKCRACKKLNICPVRAPNHRAAGRDPRQTAGNFRLDISVKYCARDARLAEQTTEQWKEQYQIRAGVEGTVSELKRAHGMRKLRVRRLPCVQFAVACKVTACNIKRWLRALLARLSAKILADMAAPAAS